MSITKYAGKDLLIKRQVTATAWAATTAYTLNQYVTNGGNTYRCTTAGTSAGSGGPTGTSLTADLTDGTAHWIFVSTDGFITVAGMRSTKFTINNEQVDVTNKSEVPWKQLMAVGVRSLACDASGVFNNDDSLNLIMSDVMNNNFPTLKIISGRGDTFVGVMQVVSIERQGEYNKEEQYSIKIESAATVTYTPGS